LEIVEPGDVRVEAFGAEDVGEALVVGAEAVGVGGVVESDQDGVVVDTDVAVESGEQVIGEVLGIPGAEGLAEALASLVEDGLGDECEGHGAVADVEVEGAGAVPTEGLVGVEEFFDVPALGEIGGQAMELVALGGAEEAFELVVVGDFAAALDQLVIERRMGGEGKRALGGGKAGPVAREVIGGNGAELGLAGKAVGHGEEQIEGGVGGDVFDQVGRVVFGVGKHQGLTGGRLEDVGGQAEQFGSSLGDGAWGGGEGEGDRLMGFGIQTEEDLGGFDRVGRLEGNVAAHLAFAPRAYAVRINGQKAALKMAARAADFSQSHLKGLGLGDGVGDEQVVDGLVGGHKRQAVGQFETLLAERVAAPDAGRAQGGLVNQLEGQAGGRRRAGASGPALKQVPRAQTQMFGYQKPEADSRAGDFVGQELANAAFDTAVIARFDADGPFGALRFDRGRLGPESVEFFFEDPTR